MNMSWFWFPTLFFRGPWWKVLAVPQSVKLHRMHSACRVFVVTLQFFAGQTILLPQQHCYDAGWRMSSGSPRITGEPVRSDDKASCRLEGRRSCSSKGTGVGIDQSPVDRKTQMLPWNIQGGPESWLGGGPGKRDFWIKRECSAHQAPPHVKICVRTASLTILTVLEGHTHMTCYHSACLCMNVPVCSLVGHLSCFQLCCYEESCTRICVDTLSFHPGTCLGVEWLACGVGACITWLGNCPTFLQSGCANIWLR